MMQSHSITQKTFRYFHFYFNNDREPELINIVLGNHYSFTMRDVRDIVQKLVTSKSGTSSHIEFIRLPVHGGTTCTILCIIGTDTKCRIICSNTGDSDALLLSRKPSGLPQENNKCKSLSVVCIYAHSHIYITYYI